MSDPAPIEAALRPNMSLVTEGSPEPYRRLAEVLPDVLLEQGLDATLGRIVDTLVDLIPHDDVRIYEADEAKRELILVLSRSRWTDEVLSETRSFGDGITGWAAEHREPVLANNAHVDPRVHAVPGTPVDPSALIAVPVVVRSQLRGALEVRRVGSETQFTDEEFLLARRVADVVGLAMDNARVRARCETLERTFLSTVEVFANALGANDEYASTNARWIADLALKVGRELRLDSEGLERLELGALFHDIGKIGIPSRILSNTGALTAEERAIVQTHPILGERILAPVERLAKVRHIVRSAHEHYDGGGYPDGLAGNQVPLESRIVLACAAFHAMTTDRPYRKALGEEEARRRLVEASGSQFDPQIVDALLRVLDA